MNKLSVLIIGGLLAAVCDSRTVTVTSTTCDGTYSVSEDDPLYLEFLGAQVTSDCKFSISASVSKMVCAKVIQFAVECSTILEYYKALYSSSYDPNERFGCDHRQREDICVDPRKTLHVVFKNNATNSTSSAIKLKFFTKDVEDLVKVDASVATVYVIIGIVIGVIFLVISVIIVATLMCYRRRKSHSGSVYRNPLTSVATTSSTIEAFPMQDIAEQREHQLQKGINQKT